MKPLQLLLVSLLLCSCEKEDAPAHPDAPVCADITIATPLSGIGDNGYYDEAVSGVFDAASASGLDVSLLRPATLDQAGEYVRKWSETVSGKRRLLILPDAGYAELLPLLQTSDTRSVLLFETSGLEAQPGVATFRISRYGAAYLSGCLAKGSEKVHIVKGKKGDMTCEEAARGFAEGYRKMRSDGMIVCHSLSDTHSGWSMPDSLYRIATDYPDDFFFPLARGSNTGIYKFSRESPFVTMLTAGMDVDCSLFSKRVPFSVIIDLRTVVKDYVSRWINGENISGHRDFGMQDGKASVRLSSLFYEINDIWEEYYTEPTYWRDIYEAHHEEAVREEAGYETTR